jgi:hypothetical protein
MATRSHAPPIALVPDVGAMRKPMARVLRVALVEREIELRLSSPAVELLFELASVLSEGEFEDRGYFGSTMITVDLARADALVSDVCDAATARRVAPLIATDQRVREQARALAIAEAEARAGCRLATPQVDQRVRASGAHIHIDLDVEAERG